MPISSIVSQPAAGSMNAAYRPVLLKVSCSLVTPILFTVKVLNISGSIVSLSISSISLSLAVSDTILFAGITGISGTYTISFVRVVTTLNYTIINITTTDTFPTENSNVGLTLNGTTLNNTAFIPPVVYCDVYVAGLYYKTVSKTKYVSKDSSNTYWLFDIQDALQEILPWAIGDNGAADLENANGSAEIQCSLRSSSFDNNGFIQPETPVPIQATGINPATSGGGTPSNTFYAVLSTLKHEEIQDLAIALSPFKYGSWGTDLLPLTHRPALCSIRNSPSSDFYPLLFLNEIIIRTVRFYKKIITGSTYTYVDYSVNIHQGAGSILLQGIGQKNLQTLSGNTINFSNISMYYLVLIDQGGAISCTTPIYSIDNFINPDIIRIHFLNYCGQFDAVDFQRPEIFHEDKSTNFQKTLPYGFARRDTGIIRQNITGNDTYTAMRICLENEMSWIQELADSPQLFIEETRNQSGVTDDYIPLIKIDGKFDKQKNNGKEYQYEFKLQFKLSNEIITLRN